MSSTPGHTMSHQPLMALNDDDPAVRQPAASDAASAALFMEGGGGNGPAGSPVTCASAPVLHSLHPSSPTPSAPWQLLLSALVA